jgi:predicted metal-dependent enzyme (double-stranded beta helix superfamily)
MQNQRVQNPHIALAADWSSALRSVTDGLGGDLAPQEVATLRDQLTELVWADGCPRADSFFGHAQPPRYRRQLIAAAPDGGYTMLLIAWPPGYVTPLHDHAGLWGIELVLDGALQVDEYFSDGDGHAPTLQPHRSLLLGSGDSAVFLDPAYVHRCRNLSLQQPALSLHVYGGILDQFQSFVGVRDEQYRASPQRAVLDAVSI